MKLIVERVQEGWPVTDKFTVTAEDLTKQEAETVCKLALSSAGLNFAVPVNPDAEYRITLKQVKKVIYMMRAAGEDNKINQIKLVRELTSLGLKDAKDLVDGIWIDAENYKSRGGWDRPAYAA